MAWKTKLLSPEETEAYFKGKYEPKVGDAWFAKWRVEDMKDWLAPEYFRDWAAKRPPVDVALPSNDGWGWTQFCIDMRTTSGGVPGPGGWKVTGEVPLVTLSPSVNIVGVYHGWIQNGVISDDCEGRKFKT
jgi:hypothetical protein